jgi:hypothetical protein
MSSTTQDLDLSVLKSSPPDGTELRQANMVFNSALASNILLRRQLDVMRRE